MHTGKPITLNGKPLGSGRLPAICTPLVGNTHEQILAEVAQVTDQKPDLLEWRVDFFHGIADLPAVLFLAGQVREAANGIPVLFTRRSIKEGGEPISLSEEAVVQMLEAVCASGSVDMVDFEMNNDPAHIARVRAAARANKVALVLSFHNFQSTPTQEALYERLLQAQTLGADVAKVAVMPQRLEDVLTVLSATLQASQKLEIPVVSMSMGGHGALTRLFGWTFGSALSFAVGAEASAPGQVPMDDMNAALDIMRRSIGPQ